MTGADYIIKQFGKSRYKICRLKHVIDNTRFRFRGIWFYMHSISFAEVCIDVTKTRKLHWKTDYDNVIVAVPLDKFVKN